MLVKAKHRIIKMLLHTTPRIMAATSKMLVMLNKYHPLQLVSNSSGPMIQAEQQLLDKIHLSILNIS